MVEKKSVRELEEAIAELKSRLPKHSVKPAMWQQLEDLEDQLALAEKDERNTK